MGGSALAGTVEITPVTTATTLPPAEVLPSKKPLPVPEQIAKDRTENAAYIQEVLAPELTGAGLAVVPPINQDVERVNQPNQFIVTDDGKFGSQFVIRDKPDSGQKNIAITVFGPLSPLSDGRFYGRATYNGTLGHQESYQIYGQDFDPADPAAAVQFVAEQNNEMRDRLALDQHP
ncbi:MAG TPA: hypothetical protein VLE74_01800 [Candidatus Saccharimonadales bacterium]|nr:hypothetical protein [Candidatus Saccharimonadales bacterium]